MFHTALFVCAAAWAFGVALTQATVLNEFPALDADFVPLLESGDSVQTFVAEGQGGNNATNADHEADLLDSFGNTRQADEGQLV